MRTIIISLFLLSIFASSHSEATEVSGRLSFTPIIGLESVQKFQPTPHMKTRTIYGARAIYKLPITAIEVEYTHAQDTSTESSTNTTYEDSEDKLRLGLRGSFTLGSFISTYLRGGAQARKNEQTQTLSNATTSTSNSSRVQPYLGTGIEFRVFQYFSLTADLLATYTPSTDPHLRDYELQPSIGISLRF